MNFNELDTVEGGDKACKNASGGEKKVRTRRVLPVEDRIFRCPLLSCEKSYTTKKCLQFHVRRAHVDELFVEKQNGDAQLKHWPSMRGVNLKTIFKKEDLDKLKHHPSLQVNQQESKKKVKDESDHYKQNFDSTLTNP